MSIKKGDRVLTPRFGTVKIEETFESVKIAKENGYTEPTYHEGDSIILGKSLDMYHMVFAAVANQ